MDIKWEGETESVIVQHVVKNRNKKEVLILWIFSIEFI